MIRNHPSLCFWCGANEWPLAKDIDQCLKKEVFPRLDPERLFVSFSTDTLFTRNYLGDNGDGPYGIQEPEWFLASVRIRLIRKPDRLVLRRSRVCGR